MQQWWARFLRLSASPAGAAALIRMNYDIDIRHLLPVICVPTLVVHSAGDQAIPVTAGRYLAQHIRGARYVELPGIDHLPRRQDGPAIIAAIEAFLTGIRQGEVDRVLATVLFTDIVDATRTAVEIGDRRWRELLGREIDTAGDGFLAAFDGPARAVRAAAAIVSDVKKLGVDIRAGVHTGECETMGEKLSGIAVHVGARVAALAGPGEVLVSNTVKDLVAGSGLRFRERGAHQLKGVPGEWHLYSVDPD